jgi:hypothetical protein
MRAQVPVAAALALILGASACGIGASVSTSGSLASNSLTGSSASLPGVGGSRAEVGRICGARAVRGRIVPNVEGPEGCGVEGAVMVESVSGVALVPQPTVTCATALALNDWVRDGVAPAFAEGGGVEMIQVAAHYSCRNVSGEPPREAAQHAAGRAVDISGFRLSDGTFVTVGEDRTSQDGGQALQAALGAACGPFPVTEGPGDGVSHAGHMHLDLGTPGEPPSCPVP